MIVFAAIIFIVCAGVFFLAARYRAFTGVVLFVAASGFAMADHWLIAVLVFATGFLCVFTAGD